MFWTYFLSSLMSGVSGEEETEIDELETPSLSGAVGEEELRKACKAAALAGVGAKGNSSLQDQISTVVDQVADLLDMFPDDS